MRIDAAGRCNWGGIVWLVVVVAVLSGVGCAVVYDAVGGAFKYEPWQMERQLSEGARRLVDAAFEGIDPEQFADYHVHLFTDDIHRHWIGFARPGLRWRSMVYLSGAGVQWGPGMPEAYVQRLIELADAFPVRYRLYIYAVDWYVAGEQGTIANDRMLLHVSNEQMLAVARQRPELFVPVVSINPYRVDAAELLRHYAEQGVRHVKWIPSSMGINPADEAIEGFYEVMREHDMVLLSHTGGQSSLRVVNAHYANPLLLRKPLEMGVRVVALHSASDGADIDLDDPERRRVASFDLLMRMMREPCYEGLLFGEASTLTFFNHLDKPLRALLEHPELHHRWVNGSDYPLSALNIVIRTSQLRRLGYISAEEARYLDEIYDFNPLLFDFVVKRTVRHPETGAQLGAELFHVPREVR